VLADRDERLATFLILGSGTVGKLVSRVIY